MTVPIVINWDYDDPDTHVSTVDEALAVFDEIRGQSDENPTIAHVTLADDPMGPILSVGLRGARGFAYFTDEFDTWYSKGDDPSATDQAIYTFQTETQKVDCAYEVSTDVVRLALEDYMTSDGLRSERLEWVIEEED